MTSQKNYDDAPYFFGQFPDPNNNNKENYVPCRFFKTEDGWFVSPKLPDHVKHREDGSLQYAAYKVNPVMQNACEKAYENYNIKLLMSLKEKK